MIHASALSVAAVRSYSAYTIPMEGQFPATIFPSIAGDM
jgi:hypothetical protein